jgi:hypothetical protein
VDFGGQPAVRAADRLLSSEPDPQELLITFPFEPMKANL